jgi:hypothetical protein
MNWMWNSGLYSTNSGKFPVVRFDKDEIEPSGSIEGGEILQ